MGQLREIVLDTETTGLRIEEGHKVIEIGCVELIDRRKTGKTFQTYVNPKRASSVEAIRVHGIKDQFLLDKPIFSKVVKDFLEFIGDSKLIIHNAPFDVKFLNHELVLCGLETIKNHRVEDSLLIARRKFPGSPASLDALCRRFHISLENRSKHGALLDADLLASVYILMQGTTQTQISLEMMQATSNIDLPITFEDREIRSLELSTTEADAHKKMLQNITNPLWLKWKCVEE